MKNDEATFKGRTMVNNSGTSIRFDMIWFDLKRTFSWDRQIPDRKWCTRSWVQQQWKGHDYTAV